MKNAKQDIRLSSVVSLEKDVANYRDTIKTMKASHADELLLLREAHEAEVKTLTTTIGQLQRELKRHQPILKGSSPSREHTLLGLPDAEASEAAEREQERTPTHAHRAPSRGLAQRWRCCCATEQIRTDGAAAGHRP